MPGVTSLAQESLGGLARIVDHPSATCQSVRAIVAGEEDAPMDTVPTWPLAADVFTAEAGFAAAAELGRRLARAHAERERGEPVAAASRRRGARSATPGRARGARVDAAIRVEHRAPAPARRPL